ncbi:hypothetical protein [Campylobacter concisus]|jgi:hypothetical protein|uniref:Uncharacterized protein n=1 Tax=Campylobacter concisus TaxID=199 RepID=A0A1Y5NEY0_9BACT|nr:hypothetical protein [Campylobacter concisus]OUT19069.1 hypothetical protein B9N61_02565 [Campylobacter concisus]QPH87903.1 hypothetical protein CVT15_03915 [Campylobacter concisus]QPI02848.1 hypothetical protein G5B95_03870 [Campylobacter concisus]
MVANIKQIFNNNFFKELNNVSDGICNDNGKQYLKFDSFVKSLQYHGDTVCSCDTILFNCIQEHIIFVEFKDMNCVNSLDDLKVWMNKKEDNLCLKIAETLLVFMHEIRQHGLYCNDFVDLSKSFFYVYKSDSYKKAIKDHIGNKLSRYNFIFKNTNTLDASIFESFLQKHNL